MNTFRNTLAVAAMLACGLALAQTANPNAKVDPKNNKVSRPVVEKPKQKLMTRDELRTCMVSNKSFDEENDVLKATQKEVLAERDAIKAMKAQQDKLDADLITRSKDLKAEIEAVKAFGAEIEAGAAKMEKEALKAKQEEYNARSNALSPRIDAFNKDRNAWGENNTAYNTRVDAYTKALDAFNERVEVLADKKDEWKEKCGNKSYDEADEIAIKKELQQKAAK